MKKYEQMGLGKGPNTVFIPINKVYMRILFQLNEILLGFIIRFTISINDAEQTLKLASMKKYLIKNS